MIPKSRRANAGGCRGGRGGGGYERTDPDYDYKRIADIRKTYDELSVEWKQTFLKGLPKRDRYLILHRETIA